MGKVICCRCLEPREIGDSVIVLDGCTAYMCLDCVDEFFDLKPMIEKFSRESQSDIFKQFCKGGLMIKLVDDDLSEAINQP